MNPNTCFVFIILGMSTSCQTEIYIDDSDTLHLLCGYFVTVFVVILTFTAILRIDLLYGVDIKLDFLKNHI